MSEEIKTSEVSKEQTSNEPAQEDFVSRNAYQEVSQDMHKYKQQLRETQAKLNEMQAQREAQEREALAEQGRWEELYKQNQAKLEQLQSERDGERNKFVDYHKKNSVLQKVGGFKRDEYNKFINVEAIDLREDGSIDEDSLNAEVGRIKQEYPELLKSSVATKLPNEAPQANQVGEKSWNEMTDAEQQAYRKQLILKK